MPLSPRAKEFLRRGYKHPELLSPAASHVQALVNYIYAGTHETYSIQQVRNALFTMHNRNGFVYQGLIRGFGVRSPYEVTAAESQRPQPTVLNPPARSTAAPAQPASVPPPDPNAPPSNYLYLSHDGQRLHHTEVRCHPQGEFVDANGNPVESYRPAQQQ
ncbi:hypothetical protein JCM8547_005886 [Rhodosporidiobolus lusitaniae]